MANPAQNQALNPARNPARNQARNPARNPARDPARNQARNTARNSARNSALDPALDPALNPARNPAVGTAAAASNAGARLATLGNACQRSAFAQRRACARAMQNAGRIEPCFGSAQGIVVLVQLRCCSIPKGALHSDCFGLRCVVILSKNKDLARAGGSSDRPGQFHKF